jgi:hypothetical protein
MPSRKLRTFVLLGIMALCGMMMAAIVMSDSRVIAQIKTGGSMVTAQFNAGLAGDELVPVQPVSTNTSSDPVRVRRAGIVTSD